MAPRNDARERKGAAHDLRWARDVRDSVRCGGVLLALLLLLDWGTGRFTYWRCTLWLALALLLFLVLYPARVSAGDGWLASRRLLREHRVCTDQLVSVRYLEGMSERLVLRDSAGGRVEIDPEVLLRNPQLWFLVDAGAQKSAGGGTLLCGATALHRLSRRIDRETAHAVFKASGLE
ncbi:hypothetical protein ACFZBP_07400 [Streptomyces sp. NPDC008086]|uniref:hypothetical protein n=1 Tax=Streptomyces sp. NPDC008086 TaxID=3364807 RepID=UPI0036ECEF47